MKTNITIRLDSTQHPDSELVVEKGFTLDLPTFYQEFGASATEDVIHQIAVKMRAELHKAIIHEREVNG